MTLEFDRAFKGLTENEPFPWQQKLYYDYFVAGKFPATCNLPTGLGKTSVVAIWVIALARRPDLVPRRLVYVVNRRTIVDQTTNEVERLRSNLQRAGLTESLRGLCGVALPDPDDPPLTISTLRGAHADNRQWLADPARPSVIVGTVDMIGSRLLFNGYRAGSWQLSRHAGLVGQDALLVHDEAHLEPAFQKLVEWIEHLQSADGSPRPLKVTAMSATSRATSRPSQAVTKNQNTFSLSDEDREHPIVKQRFSEVEKELHLIDFDASSKKLAVQLIELAWQYVDQQTRVIVFARQPELAGEIRDGLLAKLAGPVQSAQHVELLTGGIRGYERDQLITRPAVAGLLQPLDRDGNRIVPEHTTWLVATSAGEVGADFDADQMICDLAPIDSMIQRLGRVNRRGGVGRRARIDVVLDRPVTKQNKDGSERSLSPFDRARQATAKLLFNLPQVPSPTAGGDGVSQPRDASPAALQDLAQRLPAEYAAARSPQPVTITPHNVVLDAWALTSIQGEWPLSHDVHLYLHGLDDPAPETIVAWRAELDEISKTEPALSGERLVSGQDRRGIADALTLDEADDSSVVAENMRTLLKHYPLVPAELVHDRPERVAQLLVALREMEPEVQVVLIRQRTISAKRLRTMPDDIKKLASMLSYQTVLLPASVGGLNDAGMIQPPNPKVAAPVRDVADFAAPKVNGEPVNVFRRRVLITRDGDGRWRNRVVTGAASFKNTDDLSRDNEPNSETLDLPNKWTAARDQIGKRLGMQYVARLVLAKDEDGPTHILLLFRWKEALQNARDNRRISIADHNAAVRQAADRIIQRLELPEPLRQPFKFAASGHDLGKNDRRWQQAIGNIDSHAEPLAKSFGKGFDAKSLGGYRHEFGSLRHLVAQLSEDEAGDLAMHLIAAHHGRGRPHFEPSAMSDATGLPPDLSDQLRPAEISRRFARLQRRFGHWGLAWLESILMAADAEGSAISLDAVPDEVDEDEE